MRRRRQKNPLLMRILVLSIVVNVIVLAAFARFGAFRKSNKHLIALTMVTIPQPPQHERPHPVEQHKHNADHKAQPSRAHRVSPNQSHSAPKTQVASNLPQPHVVAVGGGTGDGAGAVDQGTGKAGIVTPPRTNTNPPVANNDNQGVKPQTDVVKPAPEPPKVVVVPRPDPPKIVEKPVRVVVPPAPKDPVFTAAQPLGGVDSQPKPSIPDDLRKDALDKTCTAEFVVGPDGAPTDVQIVDKTGVDELDRIAQQTAKQWRFKPATRDGQPVEGRVRLQIEFQVN